jgi:hypothetical protein
MPKQREATAVSLFAQQGEPNSIYERLKTRATLYGSDDCARVDTLWATFAPYADSHFESEFRHCTYERYWEMYLTCTLIERGFEVDCPKPGPDVRIHTPDGSVWIEAVTPAPGQEGSRDKVPEFSESEFAYPEKQIILRYRTAIEFKHGQYLKYVRDGIVNSHESYVVAVSGSRLSVALNGTSAPDILKAVLPVGMQQIHIRLSDNKCVGTDFTCRRSIEKSNGSPVSTDIFLNPVYSGISGVLFSRSDILNPPSVPGMEFIFVHNPTAAYSLPKGWLNFGREYFPEFHGDSLVIKLYNR